MDPRFRFALLLTNFIFASISEESSIPNKQLLGIDPQELSYYKSNVIKCKDGSKKFRKELLNDEFCDCPDGTDEPGTSACPEGRFYCQNAGYTPIKIFSSRVNDGICDCCDGSDEYESNINCSNTCWEAGKAARVKLKKRIEAFKEGVIVRKGEVEKACKAHAKDEADLGKLKVDEKALKELVQKLKEQKERIDKVEEEERLKKEKEEKRLSEEQEKLKELEKVAEGNQHNAIDDHEQDENSITDGDGSGKGSDQPVMQHNDEEYEDVLEPKHDISEIKEIVTNDVPKQLDYGVSEELSKEELGRLVASRWTGKDTEQPPGSVQNVEKEMSAGHDDIYNYDDDEDGKLEDDHDGLEDDHDDHLEDDHDDHLEDDYAGSGGSDITKDYEKADPADAQEESKPSWLNKIQQAMQNVLQVFVFFKASVNVSDGAHIRKEYDDLSSKLSKMQSRISGLTEKLKCDFGNEKEFYLFYDQCFESKQNKYVYKICPFKQSSQDEGYSSTRLGSWDKFDESYRVMVFSNGEKCWNGPDRSLKVRLRCGSKNEISDVDEPSRCEYVALMSTPAVCLEDKLKELEKKLEQMSTREPQSHDEF